VPENIQVSDDTISIDVDLNTDDALTTPTRLLFTNVDGEWRISGSEAAPIDIPAGVTAVDVTTQEMAFVFDDSQITDGNIAFAVNNAGEQPHQLVLAKIPEDADIQELLQSQETPEGVVEIAAGGPWNPGDGSNLVFADPLESGRYVMVCFIGNTDPQFGPEGTPHAFLGMVSEFTVP
jgi:hypothetical protein